LSTVPSLLTTGVGGTKDPKLGFIPPTASEGVRAFTIAHTKHRTTANLHIIDSENNYE
jgi:hypothetical protein